MIARHPRTYGNLRLLYSAHPTPCRPQTAAAATSNSRRETDRPFTCVRGAPRTKGPPRAQAQYVSRPGWWPRPQTRSPPAPPRAAGEGPEGNTGSDWTRPSHEGAILFRAKYPQGLTCGAVAGSVTSAHVQPLYAAASSGVCSPSWPRLEAL